MSATIHRDFSTTDLDVVTVAGSSFDKHYVTIHPGEDGQAARMWELMSEFVRSKSATVVQQDIFGPCSMRPQAMDALAAGRLPGAEWPMTWIHANGTATPRMTGTQLYAVSGVTPTPVVVDGRTVGSILESDDATYCLLGDLLPKDVSLSRSEQTRDVFETIEKVLVSIGMDFGDVVRTWFYMDHILDWYDDFNTVRSRFFTERGVFDKLVPASTGVGGGNCVGAALVADAIAIRPKNRRVTIQPIPSPLQCPALDYRSSFSRAVEVALSDHRRIYVSGTASIAPGGETVHCDDAERQVALSMEVVEAILASRGVGWGDVTRAVAYFKDMVNRPLLDAYCATHHLPTLPIAIAHSDICRDDLLFEIEVDAVTAPPSIPPAR